MARVRMERASNLGRANALRLGGCYATEPVKNVF